MVPRAPEQRYQDAPSAPRNCRRPWHGVGSQGIVSSICYAYSSLLSSSTYLRTWARREFPVPVTLNDPFVSFDHFFSFVRTRFSNVSLSLSFGALTLLVWNQWPTVAKSFFSFIISLFFCILFVERALDAATSYLLCFQELGCWLFPTLQKDKLHDIETPDQIRGEEQRPGVVVLPSQPKKRKRKRKVSIASIR